MAQQTINVGEAPNSNTGDPIRNAFIKVNANFTEVYGLGGGSGNVSNSGTPTSGQYARWTNATTIAGVAPATVLSDIGAQPAGAYQPLDGDLTALAALGGTNTIYYRSGADVWSPVTIGANLMFSGGTLAASGGGGGAGLPLVGDGVTVTANTPLLDLSQTWNNGAVAFDAIKLNVTSTAAAYSRLMDLKIGGTSVLTLYSNGDCTVYGLLSTTVGSVRSAADVGIGTTSQLYWNNSIVLIPDATGVLAQRWSTNPQSYRAYNTHTDASNYERGVFDWATAANTLTIGTQKAGTGNSRDVRFVATGSISFALATSSTPVNNGDLVIQATSNTSLTFKYKGSDGTVRSASLTLS